jgi:hypothetical protein
MNKNVEGSSQCARGARARVVVGEHEGAAASSHVGIAPVNRPATCRRSSAAS